MTPDFEWDPEKASNLAKHGVTFETAVELFEDPRLLEEEDDLSVDEYRFKAIGRVGGSILAAIYAEPSEGVIRLISMRLATARERKNHHGQVR